MDNSKPLLGAEMLRDFILRIESAEEDAASLRAHAKDLYDEAKANGFDPKIIRKVIARRKRDRDDLAEEQAILDLYESALEGGN